jgi:two-component system, NarL family, response regulator LiaR
MQPTQAIQVLLVDKHALVRSGITMLLNSLPDFQVVGEAGDAEEALLLAQAQPPDVVLSDVELPGRLSGIDLVRSLRRSHPHTRVLLLTNMTEPVLIQQALTEGAIGYLLKTISVDELTQAMRAALSGIPTVSPEVTQALVRQASSPARLMRTLTDREQQVLRLMARGWNNQQIAGELNITLSTVQFHTGNIFAKLQVRNRTEAAAFALRHDLGSGAAWASGELAA